MQHEALGGFGEIEHLDALLVVLGAERDGDQSLRLAAREQRRAVRAGQHAHFAIDIADFVERAAIRTAVRLQHLVAENALLQHVEQLFGFGLLFLGKRFHRLLLGFVNAMIAFELGIFLGVERVGQLLADLRLDLRVQRLVDRRRRDCPFLLADLGNQLADAGSDLLAAGVPVLDGFQHFFFGGVLRARFHHHDAFFGARDDDIDLGFARFVVAGVRHQLAVDRADPHAAQHMLERNVGNGERCAGADNGQRAGIALRIGRKHHGDDLRLVHEAFREQAAGWAGQSTGW